MQGVPLLYLIWKDKIIYFNMSLPYDNKVCQRVTLVGLDSTQDKRIVHEIVLKNVNQNTDTHTFVKDL